MTDSDEEDEVRDIDPPKDRPGQSGDAQSLAVLVKVGPNCPQDDGHEDGKGEIERFSRSSDGFKQNRILFRSQLFFFHYIPSDK